jgi:monodictyphenone polyketide synthase
MNITNLEVLQGLIANSDTSMPQLIHIKASTGLRSSHTILHWYNAGHESHIASAVVEYGNNNVWLKEWDRVSHLVTGRIESLERMERDGSASKLSHNMAYRLFGNLVGYADKYRGMQSVIIHDLEAVANVKLTEKTSGAWNIPPYFIDSLCHLAGLIINGGDASARCLCLQAAGQI